MKGHLQHGYHFKGSIPGDQMLEDLLRKTYLEYWDPELPGWLDLQRKQVLVEAVASWLARDVLLVSIVPDASYSIQVSVFK